jgi:hypothetical protein
MHTSEKSSGWKNKQREIDRDGSDMLKEWMSTQYKKITGNEGDWKETQEQTTNTMARPSQERHTKKKTILWEGRRNVETDRYRQLHTPLQKATDESRNDIWRKKMFFSNIFELFRVLKGSVRYLYVVLLFSLLIS